MINKTGHVKCYSIHQQANVDTVQEDSLFFLLYLSCSDSTVNVVP